jgi:hypothetical protein
MYHSHAFSDSEKISKKVDVEVCLHDSNDTQLLVSETETSKKFKIPRYGVKITAQKGIYATLRLTERRAIEYNLV